LWQIARQARVAGEAYVGLTNPKNGCFESAFNKGFTLKSENMHSMQYVNEKKYDPNTTIK